MGKQIIITGASGFLGKQLVPLLEQAGHALLLSGRDLVRLQQLFPGRKVCSIDKISVVAKGFDALLHLAVRNNDQPGTEAEFMAANHDHLSAILKSARIAGVGMLIYPASLHAEPQAPTPYGRSKFSAEQMLAQLADMNVQLLRLPAVYGSSYQGRLSQLNKLPSALRPLARQALACLKPVVHVSVLAQAIERALSSSQSGEQLVTDDNARNPFYRVSKRVLDLGFAGFVVLVLWWLLLGVWVAVRLTSSGPGIFAQERLGKHQRPFTCYKFRTMQSGTKQAGTHEISQASVTKIGHILRRTKIDELPQVWNILKGELSLVGPRPNLPVQLELSAARARCGVYDILPGVTGLGQVQGVDMSDPEKLARLDGTYVKTQTLILDVKIILATALGRGMGDRTAQ
ncbi:sugar transferase [Planktotalea arctica]|uniref:sugar transferase n=1 Tax=Planktotalea arctica TaxID=1481893 RepID=UPI000A171811|nr:sugar transferase [Planktotalea arctica]